MRLTGISKAGLGLVSVLAGVAGTVLPSRAEQGVRFNRLELEDVYRFCNMTHQPGNAMIPCLFEQTEKLARGKDFQQGNRRSEAITRGQTSGTGDAASP